ARRGNSRRGVTDRGHLRLQPCLLWADACVAQPQGAWRLRAHPLLARTGRAPSRRAEPAGRDRLPRPAHRIAGRARYERRPQAWRGRRTLKITRSLHAHPFARRRCRPGLPDCPRAGGLFREEAGTLRAGSGHRQPARRDDLGGRQLGLTQPGRGKQPDQGAFGLRGARLQGAERAAVYRKRRPAGLLRYLPEALMRQGRAVSTRPWKHLAASCADQVRGSVTPTWPWYLPPRSLYEVSHTSSDWKNNICATPSLA